MNFAEYVSVLDAQEFSSQIQLTKKKRYSFLQVFSVHLPRISERHLPNCGENSRFPPLLHSALIIS
jgi:hypothetical protein